jgi:hypothetical protein
VIITAETSTILKPTISDIFPKSSSMVIFYFLASANFLYNIYFLSKNGFNKLSLHLVCTKLYFYLNTVNNYIGG